MCRRARALSPPRKDYRRAEVGGVLHSHAQSLFCEQMALAIAFALQSIFLQANLSTVHLTPDTQPREAGRRATTCPACARTTGKDALTLPHLFPGASLPVEWVLLRMTSPASQSVELTAHGDKRPRL